MALNANQKRYVKNKLGGMSRAEAYIDAYKTDPDNTSNARKAAHKLMVATNGDVREAIRAGLDAAIQEAQEILEADSTEAAETLVELRENGDKTDGIRLRAAESILDRSGLKAPDKTEHSGRVESVIIINDIPGPEDGN